MSGRERECIVIDSDDSPPVAARARARMRRAARLAGSSWPAPPSHDVVVILSSDDEGAAGAAGAAAGPAAAPTRPRVRRPRKTSCAICLDDEVEDAHALFCGHAFCKSCLSSACRLRGVYLHAACA